MNKRSTTAVALAAVLAMVMALTTATPAGAEVDTDFAWDHRALSVSGTYTALEGQFAGDGATDVFWYAPGSAADTLWIGHEGGRGVAAFTKVSVPISGTYKPIVGDFAGDDYDDILWYAPGSAPDSLWVAAEGTKPFQSTSMTINGTFQPTALHDYTGINRKDDILWYAPGSAKDYVWHYNEAGTGTYQTVNIAIAGTFKMIVGDWNGDRLDDLVLYAAGSAKDYRWASKADASFATSSITVNGTFEPVTIHQSDRDGILWWADGSAAEAYWKSNGSTFSAVHVPAVSVRADVASLGLQGASIVVPDDLDGYFYGTSSTGAFYQLASANHDLGAGLVSLPGDYDNDGWTDVIWYGPGTKGDQLWYSVPTPASASTKAADRPHGIVATPFVVR
ncbi:MAG: hypothetical protein JWM89_374 [Acidimicrobiales bacterium]|nr:hypothetical protein [Acidimicrobiales bacterium]